MYTVYKHTSLTSNKSYVGLTKFSIKKRWNEHVYLALVKESSFHFHRAIRLYGKDDWAHEVIHENIKTAAEANFLEKATIIHFNTFEEGYNANLGGEGSAGLNPFANFTKEQKIAHSNLVSENSKNREVITIFHNDHGLLTGIQSELALLINVNTSRLGSMVCGKHTHIKGWFLYKGQDYEYNTQPIYTFVHEEYGEETLSLKEMCKKYNLSKGSLSSVTSGRRTHTKSWYLKNMV